MPAMLHFISDATTFRIAKKIIFKDKNSSLRFVINVLISNRHQKNPEIEVRKDTLLDEARARAHAHLIWPLQIYGLPTKVEFIYASPTEL